MTGLQNPQQQRKILITGSSGFFGRAVVAAIRRAWPSAVICGIDVVPPKSDPPDQFEMGDITSSKLQQQLVVFRPDTVIHLAFVVNPMHDEKRMHEINVEGTRNLLAAVGDCGATQLLVSSSATAYGAWPDNPNPMFEDQPLRARCEYRYADHKTQVEMLLRQFTDSNPGINVSWIRPCMAYGRDVSNFLTTILMVPPLLVLPGGDNPIMQFVHLDDVGAAIVAILACKSSGPFNLAPPDTVTMKDIARMSGRRTISMPFAMCWAAATCWWALRLPVLKYPAPLWYFIRYPWIVSSKRLTSETGFLFRHSSNEVVRMMLHDFGRLRE